jgi:hypothetical protein
LGANNLFAIGANKMKTKNIRNPIPSITIPNKNDPKWIQAVDRLDLYFSQPVPYSLVLLTSLYILLFVVAFIAIYK